ncbi:hypothetical protein [Candidatus Francisella endociliophora]|nr:hypothetical protein [Francisella sp. FSC1006]
MKDFFTTLKSIVGISAFAFISGALYIHIITSYYGINDFINISVTDYILYFAQMFFYSYNDNLIDYKIILLVGYFFFFIFYFSASYVVLSTKRGALSFKFIIYFFFFLCLIGIISYSQIKINENLKNDIEKSIKTHNDYEFILRDNNFLYFQDLKKASIAVVPIVAKASTDEELENSITILKPYPEHIKKPICSFIKNNNDLEIFKKDSKYHKEVKEAYCGKENSKEKD